MIIGILHFSNRPKLNSHKLSTNLKLLRDSIKAMGHKPKIIRNDKCQLHYTSQLTEVLYNGKPFPKVDVIIPRFDIIEDVALSATIVDQLKIQGIPVIQEYKSLVRAKNKLRTLQFMTRDGIPVPNTIVVKRFEYLDIAIQKIGGFPIIIKTPFGSLGKGVAIVESRRALNSSFDMLLMSPQFSYILIQEYVEEAGGKDIRIFVVDGKVVAAMERASASGDFRSNLAQGGNGVVAKLSKREEEIAIAAAESLRLKIAGVDVLRSKHGPVIMEVNCNPGLKGITEVTGIDVAGEIVKYAVKYAKKQMKLKNLKLKKKPKSKNVKPNKKSRG
ncbi:RimK family alpha-L-glutamate ligase [Patescibacteria group bacterium]|nr:RimK family alpha-L-glutamate ligase [Patescibacteria group bacterium]